MDQGDNLQRFSATRHRILARPIRQKGQGWVERGIPGHDADSPCIPVVASDLRLRHIQLEQAIPDIQRSLDSMHIHPDVLLVEPPYRLHGNGELRRHFLRWNRGNIGRDPYCSKRDAWLWLGCPPSHHVSNDGSGSDWVGAGIPDCQTKDGLLRNSHHLPRRDSEKPTGDRASA